MGKRRFLDVASECLVPSVFVGAGFIGALAAHETINHTKEKVANCAEVLKYKPKSTVTIPDECKSYILSFDSELKAVGGEVVQVYTLPSATDFEQSHTPNTTVLYGSFVAGAELAAYMFWLILDKKQ